MEEWPNILIAMYIPQPTPFTQSFLEHISNLDYPKDKIDIFLHSVVRFVYYLFFDGGSG